MTLRTQFGPVILRSPADAGSGEGTLSAKQALGIMGDMQEAAEPAPRENPAIAGRKAVEERAAETNLEPATNPDEGDGAAPQELADEADTTPPETEPGSETGTEDPAETPTIDPPRSWTKAEKEAFAALPREHQQNIAERERSRELDIRRGQNEAAERIRAAEAREQAAEQARQQYENALPNLLQTIQNQTAAEFQDIKSWDDVKRMADEDFPRYLRFDAMYKQSQAVQQEVQQSQARQQQQAAQNFEAFRQRETARFLELAPEYGDPAKAPKLQADVRHIFDDVGVTEPELRSLWSGQSGISLHDHRVQMIIRDAVRWRTAQKAVKTAQPKPSAPVQRPGIASNKGESRRADIDKLDQTLSKTGSRQAALALMRARSAH